MTKIISFANQKGGAGKTTLLMLTAAAIHKRTDKKVLVVDSDPQQSVKTIYKKEQEKGLNSYDVFAFNWNQAQPEINLEKTLTLAKRKYDLILMDVPGNLKSVELYHSLVQSDLVIIPIVASILDINATIGFLAYLEDIAKEHNKKWEIYGVINKKDKTIEHALLHKLSGKAGMQLFYSSISNLVRYRRLVSTANEIIDSAVTDDEFNQYFDEFRKNCFI